MRKQTLLLITDISGFTRFVSQRNPEEGVRMATEMLNIILRNNKLKLKLSEIEGDAVFFYSHDSSLTFDQLRDQIRRTFREFSAYLAKHSLEEVLGIKFILHSGLCSTVTLAGQSKPFGPEVIRIHRLLKRDTSQLNYLLVTESAASSLHWVPGGTKGAIDFEHLGTTDYRLFDRAFLDSSLREKPMVGVGQRLALAARRILQIPVAETIV